MGRFDEERKKTWFEQKNNYPNIPCKLPKKSIIFSHLQKSQQYCKNLQGMRETNKQAKLRQYRVFDLNSIGLSKYLKQENKITLTLVIQWYLSVDFLNM